MSSSIQRSSHFQFDPVAVQSPLSVHPPKLRGGLSSHDGPINQSPNLQTSLTTSGSFHTANFALSGLDEGQHELLSGNMSLSVLHMHEVHHRKRRTTSGAYRNFGAEDAWTQQETRASNIAGSVVYNRGVQHQTNVASASATSDMLSSTSSAGSVILQKGGPTKSGQVTDLSRVKPVQSAGSSAYQSSPYETLASDVTHATLPYPHDDFDDEAASLQGLSSLPPLPAPHSPFTLQQQPTTSTDPHPELNVGFKPAGEHMPRIREDSTEHELDTSASPQPAPGK